MSKHHVWKLCLAGLGACLLSVATAAPVRAQEGVAERLGAQLDRGIDRLSNEFRQGWDRLRNAVDKMGVQGRVYSRLRWDKNLAESRIDVDVPEEGTVTLRGWVDSDAAKQKAVQLTSDTVGVTRVVDELNVEAPRVEPAPPTTDL